VNGDKAVPYICAGDQIFKIGSKKTTEEVELFGSEVSVQNHKLVTILNCPSYLIAEIQIKKSVFTCLS